MMTTQPKELYPKPDDPSEQREKQLSLKKGMNAQEARFSIFHDNTKQDARHELWISLFPSKINVYLYIRWGMITIASIGRNAEGGGTRISFFLLPVHEFWFCGTKILDSTHFG
jgi:hypothetical protein